MKIEIVEVEEIIRGRLFLRKVFGACQIGAMKVGHKVTRVEAPSSKADVIVIWGLGHPTSKRFLKQERARNSNVIGLDLGYWDRANKYRITINDHHPQAIVMRRAYPSGRDYPELRDTFKPDGPILLCGTGHKSAAQYDEKVGEWERRKATELRKAFRGRQIFFRPKQGNPKNIQEIEGMHSELHPIDDALNGTSLVVCRHSNVGIDAIVANVPVITEGGAVAAIYGPELKQPKPIPIQTRKRFLQNLAWFQWSVLELAQPETWQVVEQMISDART